MHTYDVEAERWRTHAMQCDTAEAAAQLARERAQHEITRLRLEDAERRAAGADRLRAALVAVVVEVAGWPMLVRDGAALPGLVDRLRRRIEAADDPADDPAAGP